MNEHAASAAASLDRPPALPLAADDGPPSPPTRRRLIGRLTFQLLVAAGCIWNLVPDGHRLLSAHGLFWSAVVVCWLAGAGGTALRIWGQH